MINICRDVRELVFDSIGLVVFIVYTFSVVAIYSNVQHALSVGSSYIVSAIRYSINYISDLFFISLVGDDWLVIKDLNFTGIRVYTESIELDDGTPSEIIREMISIYDDGSDSVLNIRFTVDSNAHVPLYVYIISYSLFIFDLYIISVIVCAMGISIDTISNIMGRIVHVLKLCTSIWIISNGMYYVSYYMTFIIEESLINTIITWNIVYATVGIIRYVVSNVYDMALVTFIQRVVIQVRSIWVTWSLINDDIIFQCIIVVMTHIMICIFYIYDVIPITVVIGTSYMIIFITCLAKP